MEEDVEEEEVDTGRTVPDSSSVEDSVDVLELADKVLEADASPVEVKE